MFVVFDWQLCNSSFLDQISHNSAIVLQQDRCSDANAVELGGPGTGTITANKWSRWRALEALLERPRTWEPRYAVHL